MWRWYWCSFPEKSAMLWIIGLMCTYSNYPSIMIVIIHINVSFQKKTHYENIWNYLTYRNYPSNRITSSNLVLVSRKAAMDMIAIIRVLNVIPFRHDWCHWSECKFAGNLLSSQGVLDVYKIRLSSKTTYLWDGVTCGMGVCS